MDFKVSFKRSTKEITITLPCESCFFYSRYVLATVYKDMDDCKHFKRCMRKALIDSGNDYPLRVLLIRRA